MEELLARKLIALHRDPWLFLKYCVFTYDSSDPSAPPRSPFPAHLQYVRLLVQEYQQSPQIVIEKSRQLFVSWTFAALFSWEMLTKHNRLGLIFSQDESKAIEFGKRVDFILNNIPDHHWPKAIRPKHISTQAQLQVPELNNSLLFMTASSNKGHGYTPSFSFFDEFGYHPNAEEAYRAIIGGAVKDTSRIYVVSTPPPIYGDEPVKFYQLCDDTLNEEA